LYDNKIGEIGVAAWIDTILALSNVDGMRSGGGNSSSTGGGGSSSSKMQSVCLQKNIGMRESSIRRRIDEVKRTQMPDIVSVLYGGY